MLSFHKLGIIQQLLLVLQVITSTIAASSSCYNYLIYYMRFVKLQQLLLPPNKSLQLRFPRSTLICVGEHVCVWFLNDPTTTDFSTSTTTIKKGSML